MLKVGGREGPRPRVSPEDFSPSSKRAASLVVAAFAFVTIYFTGVFPPYPNVNELSRFQTVVSFVERGTFAIDEAIGTLGDHGDHSTAGGHFYSSKAPGPAFAGIPVYRALRLFLTEPRSGTSAIFVAMRILTVSLVCVLALARFWRLLARAPAGGSTAPLITLAVAFGTPYLFYARSFFSHAWTASLLFLAWDLLRESEAPMRQRREAVLVGAAGLLAGWASISEYAVAPIALLLAWRAAAKRSWRLLIPFAVGAAVPLTLLLVYQAICFGSPWIPSYARLAHPTYAEGSRVGVFGIVAPNPVVAAKYLLHPNRGLLLASPFWLWIAPGFLRWWRSRRERTDFVFSLVGTVSFFVLLTGYIHWEGGWCLGSRFLLPALFFAALPLRFALAGALSRGLFAAAVVFSVANHLLLTSAFPYFPPSLSSPAANGSWFFLSHGWVAPNLATLAGAGVYVSLFLPAAVTALLLLLCLRAFGPTLPSRPVAVLLALALCLATLLFPPELPAWDRQWREGTLRLFVSA